MFCLIRCAVLLNAALVRTCSDSNVIKQDLKQLNQHLLTSAEAEQKDVNLIEKTEKVKLLVNKMREDVNKELSKIPKVEEHQSKDDLWEQELNKVEAIESLQNKISDEYTKIMANLAKDCEQIMGKAPCRFAIAGMGSLARKEITPFSDFEHVIVLDSKCDDKNENILNYFRWYSVIFQIILVNLGETIVPSVLNTTNSKLGSWFYDDITKSGISFDGTFPWASKYPLGRQQLTRNKDWKTELIKSVPNMLKYLNSDESLKNGYHLGDILTKICYVYGDQSLYQEFKSGVYNILKKTNKNLKQEILNQIVDDLENSAIRSVILKITEKGECNVKKDIYRVTTLFISAMGRLKKITTHSCFDIIRKLAKMRVISNYAKHHLMYAIAIACEMRLRWYMVNRKQKDNISDVEETSKFLEIIGEISAFSYFQIAYALQCDISKRFDLKKRHYYSHPDLLNINIYSSFRNWKKVEDCINTFKVTPKEQPLLDFDTCLRILRTKKTLPTNTLSLMASSAENEECSSFKFYLIGQKLFDMNKFIDAKEYFEKALAIQQTKSNNVTAEKHVANLLHDVGRCLIKENKLSEARDSFEKALEIKQQISTDIATDRDVAITLNEIGRCLIKMNKLNDAKECLEKALKIKQLSNDINTNRDMAFTLNDIGRCLIKMNKLADAKKYFEKALEIKQKTSNNVATDRDVAFTLNEIGQCLTKMNKHDDAKEYLERALKIRKRTSNNIATDRDVAFSYCVIGRCLIKMNKLADAKKYFEKALEIKQKTSNNVATDRDVAFTLNEIGQCLTKMNKHDDAKEYLERALKIRKRTSNNIATDRDVAFSYCVIGRCLIKMNKLADAKKYFEKALEIKQKTSNNVATDRDVAFTLNEIGQCLTKMNKHDDAKEYLERALKIRKRTSNNIATDRDVAFSYCVIGRCLTRSVLR